MACFTRDQQDIAALIYIINRIFELLAAKVNCGQCEAFAVDEGPGGLQILPDKLIWKKDSLKYLGIYLGNKSIMDRKWAGLMEKIKGRLAKWTWIHSHMFYRGRVLDLNNVGSLLWHHLNCVEPPSRLLAQI